MSPDEMVDIVDEKGFVLGVAPKSHAHKEGLLHKVVISEVIDSKNRWLLARQSKDRQDPGLYVSPMGGHVAAGEADEDALKREAFEELGLEGDFQYEYIDKAVLSRHVIGRYENHLFIVYKIYSDAKPVLNQESESYKYFTENDLKKMLKENPGMFGDAFHFVMKTFFPEVL